MPVFRYRSVTDMPPPWTDPADPRNLQLVSEMLRFYRRYSATPDLPRGVRRFRTIEALNEARGDPYRR
ncbi:hypothetical protein L6Q96_17165 [Candidatus Binatia bacterium]|nr:hypothetical protein [Candidatus Binatia bacterium]